MYKARNTFKVNASFKTWLYTIANNHFNDYYRKKKRQEGINQGNPGYLEEDIVAEESYQPEHQVEKEEQHLMMLKYVAALPVEQRDVFLLREEGLKIIEIANVLDINKELAKSRLRYAVNKLHEWLHPDE